MSLGTEVQLSSHEYPNYYPPYAYVLWTFQYADSTVSSDLRYRVTFGYVHIQSYDHLKVGTGWDPNNYNSNITSFYGYYSGYPSDLVLPAGDMFVEFYANSYYEGQGFQLEMSVLNITGIDPAKLSVQAFKKDFD